MKFFTTGKIVAATAACRTPPRPLHPPPPSETPKGQIGNSHSTSPSPKHANQRFPILPAATTSRWSAPRPSEHARRAPLQVPSYPRTHDELSNAPSSRGFSRPCSYYDHAPAPVLSCPCARSGWSQCQLGIFVHASRLRCVLCPPIRGCIRDVSSSSCSPAQSRLRTCEPYGGSLATRPEASPGASSPFIRSAALRLILLSSSYI